MFREVYWDKGIDLPGALPWSRGYVGMYVVGLCLSVYVLAGLIAGRVTRMNAATCFALQAEQRVQGGSVGSRDIIVFCLDS